MTSLLDLYRGAAISPTAAKQAGAVQSQSFIDTAVERRRKLLTEGLASGTIKPQNLGPNDSALVGGINIPKQINSFSDLIHGPAKATHGISGFFTNLSNDVADFGAEFVPGVVETAKAGIHDIGEATGLRAKGEKGGSQLLSRVVEPAVKGVASDVGNVGKAITGNKKAAEALYQHPLNPLLDIGSVASGGAGAAARLGATLRAADEANLVSRGVSSILGDAGAQRLGTRLQSLTDRTRGYGLSQEPRPNRSEVGPLPERGYSARPLTKLFQSATDKFIQSDLRGAQTLRETQNRLQARAYQRASQMLKEHEKTRAIEAAFAPMIHQFANLTPNESDALHLALRGVNTDDRLAGLQEFRQRALRNENPEGYNASDFPEVDRRFLEHQANLPEEVKELAKHPNEAMINAAEVHAADISKGHELLDPGVAEHHDEHVLQVQRFLDENADLFGLKTDSETPTTVDDLGEVHTIDPNYVPSMTAKGYHWHQPGRIESALSGAENIDPLTGRKAGRFVKEPSQYGLEIPTMTRANMLAPDKPTFLHSSTGRAFLVGASRTDSRVFLDHAAQREKYLVESAYKQSDVNRFAVKDADGKPIPANSETDVVRALQGTGLDPDKFTYVHPTFPIKWFKAETVVAKDVLNLVQKLHREGIDPNSEMGDAEMNELLDLHAKEFVKANFMALKQPGVIVSRDFANYQYKFATVNDPFNNAGARFIKKYIDVWRRFTLPFMPRWAINTAVGTFLQAMVHGSIRPRDWLMARNLQKESNLAVGAGNERFRVDQEGVARGLPAGVNLKNTTSATTEELLPQEKPGWMQRNFGASFPLTAHKAANAVQATEDYFRRGMYVSALKPELRQYLAEQGETISSWLKQFGDKSYDGMIREALAIPQVREAALVRLNKFAYNYGHLGPWERRYVRQFIPFWGWYKFVTKLMWRLPAEYPGRTRIMNFLSQVGLEQQNELGPIPDWLRGSIILNLKGGHLNYLAGKGLNPFSQFGNPLMSPHGANNGILTFGQLNPVLQSLVSASGLDPLTGNSSPLSPEDNVVTGLFGDMTNAQGQSVAPGAVAPVWRFVSGLMIAFPQYQLLNKYWLNPMQGASGASNYPDSVPFLHFRPKPTGIQSNLSGLPGAAVGMTGLTPKGYDLGPFQQRVAANQALFRAQSLKQRAKLKSKLSTK